LPPMARAIGAGSATGEGLVVAPRRLAAFAMRVAAEARAELVRAALVGVELTLRGLRVVAAAAEGMAALSAAALPAGVVGVRRPARPELAGDERRPVDLGAGFAPAWVALARVVLGLVTALASSVGAGVDFRVVLEAFAAGLALAVLLTAAVGALGSWAAALAAAGSMAAALSPLARVLTLGFGPLAWARPDRPLAAVVVTARVRWESTKAHSSSLRLAGLAPLAWATRAAFSMSATRLLQEVAKRLSDWDLAPLSTRVSITPAADTFLRRRLKISFWSWAIRASALSLSVIVS